MSKSSFMIFTALILGLGWAIRGHFGHEWGASWAGAMGALAILAASKRKDWLRRAPVLTALGAVGWAVGGMMSYGIVIGYGRGDDFGNVLYGLSMLAVIGGLYGFIGGGLFALGLETTEDKKPQWASLITEMFIGGFLIWGFFIYQLEWFMTPPRSELWAGCLGAAFALSWYLYREGYFRALRVAGYSALGAGFGFAFGNFIQTMGYVSGAHYNWWNVMEFTLGFCGALGMAYAVITRKWPQSAKPSKIANWLALLFVAAVIPLINYIDAFEIKGFVKLAQNLNIDNPEQFAVLQMWFGFIIIVIITITSVIIWHRYQDQEERLLKTIMPYALFIYALYYTVFGHIKNGIFYRGFPLNSSETPYIFIILLSYIVWFFNRKKDTQFPVKMVKPESWKCWLTIIGILLFLLIIITIISINSHGALGGAHERF